MGYSAGGINVLDSFGFYLKKSNKQQKVELDKIEYLFYSIKYKT